MLVYVMFSFWIQICRKLYFTNLANPKNPNLNLDSMDYGFEIHLLKTKKNNSPCIFLNTHILLKVFCYLPLYFKEISLFRHQQRHGP